MYQPRRARCGRNDAGDSIESRLQVLVGLSGRVHSTDDLPPEFSSQRSPSPRQALALPGLKRRTQQTLRRYLAAAGDPSVDWTYARLARIRGFGIRALLDVIEGEKRHARAPGHQVVTAPATYLVRSAAGAQQIRESDLFRAVALITRWVPAEQTEIDRLLADAGLRSMGLTKIERAARFFTHPLAFRVLRRDRLAVAVPAEQLALAAKIHNVIRRTVLYRGLASVHRVALRVGTTDLRLVRLIAAAHPGCRWLDGRVWFSYETTSRAAHRLLQRMQASSGAGPMSIRDTSDAPPPPVVAALVAALKSA